MTAARDILVIDRSIDVAAWEAAVRRDEGPRHYALELARRTGLDLVGPVDVRTRRVDRLLRRLIGRPVDWALARRTRHARFAYVTDENVGIAAVLLRCWSRSKVQRTSVFINRFDRTRVQIFLRFCRLFRIRCSFVTDTPLKRDGLADALHIDPASVTLLSSYPVDERFFRPADAATEREGASKAPPLVVSAGLANRDYKTLARAVEGLDVEVDICAMSPDAAPAGVQWPAEIPPNMHFADRSIRELRDLYQRADVVVLSITDNNVRFGLSVALEAMSCGRPLIVTRTAGTIDFIERGVAIGVTPGDAAAMRAAIVSVIEDPALANRLGQAGRLLVENEHSTDRYVFDLVQRLNERGWQLSLDD